MTKEGFPSTPSTGEELVVLPWDGWMSKEEMEAAQEADSE